jgi:hypothetical protein
MNPLQRGEIPLTVDVVRSCGFAESCSDFNDHPRPGGLGVPSSNLGAPTST